MVPESHVPRLTLLKKMSCLQCFLTVCLILLGFAACTWINLLKLTDSKRCLCRIFTCIAVIKIYKLRLSVLQLCNDQSHLKSPVTKMNITNHLMSYETADSLNTFTNNCRTEMTYMKRFGNVRSAVIDYDGLRLFGCVCAKLLILLHLLQIICKKLFADFQIDKSGLYHFFHGKYFGICQIAHYVICDHKWCFLISLSSRHGTIALVFAKVRTVGNAYFTVG